MGDVLEECTATLNTGPMVVSTNCAVGGHDLKKLYQSDARTVLFDKPSKPILTATSAAPAGNADDDIRKISERADHA